LFRRYNGNFEETRYFFLKELVMRLGSSSRPHKNAIFSRVSEIDKCANIKIKGQNNAYMLSDIEGIMQYEFVIQNIQPGEIF
jgi:hypothetical protein